jgi:GR25 family glycosyltransferase involved in LPS biosynthesis
MLDCELISKIYVINLERCKDRKQHIEDEFSRVGITNYEFIKAIDKTEQQVIDLMKSDFVYKGRCFRCKRPRLCNCTGKKLIPGQIGNWCSFIKVMDKIIEDEQTGLIMICEDDIKFKEGSINIINNFITHENLANKYKINFNEPIVIRLSNCYDRNFTEKLNIKNIKFNQNAVMSNPCFLINLEFAKIFKEKLKKIKTTSDIFIHSNLPLNIKIIQHFTFNKPLAYQLSFLKQYSQFKSEIRN